MSEQVSYPWDLTTGQREVLEGRVAYLRRVALIDLAVGGVTSSYVNVGVNGLVRVYFGLESDSEDTLERLSDGEFSFSRCGILRTTLVPPEGSPDSFVPQVTVEEHSISELWDADFNVT